MNNLDKKVLTVQDISCVGQCSLTVALPIISACGIETAVLPSAVLSTHTGGFSGYTFRDLTEDIPGIMAHWEKEHIKFDAIYSGYLGSLRQIELVRELAAHVGAQGCIRIVDPAMADNGKLYVGFDSAFAGAMAGLCGSADYTLPNITEAAMMTNTPYVAEGYDEAYIVDLMKKVLALGAGCVVLTGVSYSPDKLGVAVLRRGEDVPAYYFHERLPRGCHGTGDIFASAFCGALMRGKEPCAAARIAADYVLDCMKATLGDESHGYGAKFERVLPHLIRALDE